MKILPWRFTTLHFGQRFFTDAETFMSNLYLLRKFTRKKPTHLPASRMISI